MPLVANAIAANKLTECAQHPSPHSLSLKTPEEPVRLNVITNVAITHFVPMMNYHYFSITYIIIVEKLGIESTHTVSFTRQHKAGYQ